MKFQSTSLYQDSLVRLTSAYSTLLSDVSEEFANLTFEEIFAKKYVLRDSGIAKVLKVRIANSEQNKGKSAGFRLILIADKRTSEVTFLNVFAKTGVDAKDNISKDELKACLSSYKIEKKSKTLIELDPKNSFEVKDSIS